MISNIVYPCRGISKVQVSMGGLSMQPWGKDQIIWMKLTVPKIKGKKRYANPYVHASNHTIIKTSETLFG